MLRSATRGRIGIFAPKDTLKVYAVTGEKRLAAAPEIPTVAEAGLPGFYISIWQGSWAPKGTPKEIMARLNSAVVDALASPSVRQRFDEVVQEIPPRSARHRKRSALSKEPKSRNGGLSSRRRASRLSKSTLSILRDCP
jgi:hypothetical protein